MADKQLLPTEDSQSVNDLNVNGNLVKHIGLTSAQATEKLRTEGSNSLPSSKPKNFLSIAFGVVKEPMFILLVACGTLYLVMGDMQEGLMLLGFVFVIMGIEFFQEKKTEKALDALKDLASPRALVIRDGVETRIAGIDVVTGDLLVLQEGDRVPADATVLNSVNLLADESLLTGEPVSVRKIDWDGIVKNIQPGGDDLPFVYSGSMIVQGNGVARVTSIGINTEIGKIGKALEGVKEEPTRLKIEMGSLVKKLTIIAAVLCLLVIIGYTISRGSLANGFLAGITLAMAMIPEEFPVILTIFMALGAWRMSKKKVLTRNPSAIETLGSATVLCTDKTGTLTENKMTVSKLFNGKDFFTTTKAKVLDSEFHEIMEYAMLSSQTNPFDPMEKAITHLGDLYLKGTEHIHQNWEMIKEYSLSKDLLAMSRVFSLKGTTEKVIATKGAPEAIFDLCHLDDENKTRLSVAVEELAAGGLRVLGVAKAKIIATGLPEIQHDFDFEFIGLIGLSDPIRKNVKQAVSECFKAGIRVIMITGDYPVTAKHIALEIGLVNPDLCITGQELQLMTEDELCEKMKETNVFARVIPEQKLKIVNALKKNNEIVAMTGDGINDAPALKAANIGIAMGEKGTDVAREASSLVLMDDNFASIVGAVKMGRRIFDNLQKAFGYIFAIHVPIAGLSLFPILLADFPIILWPVHIVFLELIIDPACSIIFEAEKEEKHVMSRPPKGINEPFFGSKKILFSCLQGVGILIITLAVYMVGLRLGYEANEVRAMAFTTLIVSNIAVILTNRSWTDNIFQIIITPNKAVLWVVGGAVFFLALILNTPFFLDLFQFQKLSFINVVICSFAGLSTIIWFELYKLTNLRKHIPL
ncbi:MAG: cation-translocating P-type ATPase [Bacteroidales bacterium]|nr:cation-translocating P-type ATPase [Bacteroidales bacterium]